MKFLLWGIDIAALFLELWLLIFWLFCLLEDRISLPTIIWLF